MCFALGFGRVAACPGGLECCCHSGELNFAPFQQPVELRRRQHVFEGGEVLVVEHLPGRTAVDGDWLAARKPAFRGVWARRQTENELPQPQVVLACGFLIWNEAPIMSST